MQSDGRRNERWRGSVGARQEDAFDHWLRRSLASQFDAVIDGPLPDALCRLVERDGADRRRDTD